MNEQSRKLNEAIDKRLGCVFNWERKKVTHYSSHPSDIVGFVRKEVLEACKEAGLRFLPKEWNLPSNWWNLPNDKLLDAINSQIKEIEAQ